MANDLNRWQGIGRLGRDPEIRYTPNGAAVANLSIACGSTWKDKNTGEKKEATEWGRMVGFGRLAEIIGEYLKKGQQIFAEGRLQTRKWQDKEGHDRYSTEVVIDNMQMLGSKRDDAGADAAKVSSQAEAYAKASGRSSEVAKAAPVQSGTAKAAYADFDDDIPF